MKIENLIDSINDFGSLSQKEQIKIVSFFWCSLNDETNFFISNIRKEFENNQLHIPSNIGRDLKKLVKEKVLILNSSKGYSFHRTVKQELESQYLINKHEKQVSTALSDLLGEINGKEQKNFLIEAINCFETHSYRASIIMVWLLTIDILQEHVLVANNLIAFKSALVKHGKYKKLVIAKKEDFSDINEGTFIELLRTAKLISNDTRKILDEKLGIRNTASHPNSIVFKEYKVINFIQDLVVNIIKKYQ